jgi:F0F1-type ATP synthase membrane subunit b/b'
LNFVFLIVERKASKHLHQRDIQFNQQITEYEKRLEQADLHSQQLQSELEKLREEKINFNETIHTITHDLETLKIELQNRGLMTFSYILFFIFLIDRNDTEYKSKTDQSHLEMQHLQSKLKNLEDEKTTMENELNNTIDTLKQEFEKHQNQKG